MSACSGDDDAGDTSSSSTTTTTIAGLAEPTTTTTAAPTTTAPATTPPAQLELVTEGATIVVANASGVDGAAGRMTDMLEVVGFTAGDAANSTEGPLASSKIYYAPDNAGAKPVADSLREALGGGDIEVLELTEPAPLGEPDAIGDATVLLAMGNDTADKSLDELQGRVVPADDSADEDTAEEDTAEEDTSETTDEESSGEASTEG